MDLAHLLAVSADDVTALVDDHVVQVHSLLAEDLVRLSEAVAGSVGRGYARQVADRPEQRRARVAERRRVGGRRRSVIRVVEPRELLHLVCGVAQAYLTLG